MTTSRAPESCVTCAETTRTARYCAASRCYCGHADCPAIESWIDVSALPVGDAPRTTTKHRSSWDDREGSTWIDKL